MDRAWLLERHAVIKNAEGQLQLLSPLKRAQRMTLAVMEWSRSRKQPVRLIIGKSRKQGESTLIEADMYAEVVSRGIDALVLAHDRQTSEYIFGMTHRFHEYWDKAFSADIPPIWKPREYKGQVAKGELRFNNHEGHILVGTAGGAYAGTGLTPSYIHASEVSKWERGGDVATSLFQSIADKPGTTMVLESTFNGYDGLFLPIWEEAWNNSRLRMREEKGKFVVEFEVTDHGKWNGFIPLFISAADDENIWRGFQDEDEKKRFVESLDEYERGLMEQMGVLPEFLQGRRFLYRHKCRSDMSVLRQEYPVTPQEAVRASGRSRFNVELLEEMAVRIEVGRLMSLERTTRWDKKIVANSDGGSLLRVFRDPVAGHRYVVGVDTAEGKLDEHGRDPDDSVAMVFDADAGLEQVAVYAGKVSPENLVVPCLLLAEWYGNAFVVIESNSSGMHLCIEFQKKYENLRLYHRDDYKEDGRPNRAVGWRTHVGNRESVLIAGLATAIEDRQILFHDERTIMECKRFVYKTGGGTSAEEGYHDDHVIAAALCVQGARSAGMARMADRSRENIVRKELMRRREADSGRSSLTGY